MEKLKAHTLFCNSVKPQDFFCYYFLVIFSKKTLLNKKIGPK